MTSLVRLPTLTPSFANSICNASLLMFAWFSPPPTRRWTSTNLLTWLTKLWKLPRPAIADTRPDSAEVKQLRDEVTRLADLVASLTTRSRRRSTSRPRCTQSPGPPNPPPTDSFCWYQAKYGEAARKCKELGKLPGRTLAATGGPGPPPSRLFYVTDPHTHTRFLIDTVSEVSTIPPSPADRRRPPASLTLMAVNDTPIRTYGKRSLTLNLSLG